MDDLHSYTTQHNVHNTRAPRDKPDQIARKCPTKYPRSAPLQPSQPVTPNANARDPQPSDHDQTNTTHSSKQCRCSSAPPPFVPPASPACPSRPVASTLRTRLTSTFQSLCSFVNWLTPTLSFVSFCFDSIVLLVHGCHRPPCPSLTDCLFRLTMGTNETALRYASPRFLLAPAAPSPSTPGTSLALPSRWVSSFLPRLASHS